MSKTKHQNKENGKYHIIVSKIFFICRFQLLGCMNFLIIFMLDNSHAVVLFETMAIGKIKQYIFENYLFVFKTSNIMFVVFNSRKREV